ncbi:unnamed protein product [Chrysodeixis includens]|uniref:Uncharacterized protein n=1 Tax=Chrysodeixis includens TaxID=689277 RepID=A0A9N8KU18_CHRIL|nr:unnamed protein product [Chrysodeixis includens]
MLISKVPDSDGGKGESTEVSSDVNNSHDYQTANELFELMAKNQNFDTSNVDTLTTRDLVLLYKNIDLGTKLMSNANELKRKRPNQHVETIVYNDEPESDASDVSDIYSSEDLTNVFLINKERLDLLNAPSSAENTLCHKFGNVGFHTSDLTTAYDKHFLFKDPYIEEQLKCLKLKTNSAEIEGAVLPASLLDYICCKRLEDNYNFYMENIIRYVQHTIEQLKRISNGDYLTEKVKEKWREVDNSAEDDRLSNTKVLATSTSIPLHVENKVGGRKSTWDDIVHSAVDIRSLSKILEKKIVLEVPKLLCGSYKLLSKCCADNVIISCKKEKRPIDESSGESRVDVVFQLKRSETGQVISKISSIMILQTAPMSCDPNEAVSCLPVPLPLPYKELSNEIKSPKSSVKIIELEPIHSPNKDNTRRRSLDTRCNAHGDNVGNSLDYACSDEGCGSAKNSLQGSSESSDAVREVLKKKLKHIQQEAAADIKFADDLRLTIQKLAMQTALTEESGEDMSSTANKKKSPTRSRIKSPYENQSYIMEEKKRRKLLEIRERRERKKMALAENCKITKHKYGKGAIMPQSASSVTKLSISNKSFYNSIYGQSAHVDSKQTKGRYRNRGKRETADVTSEGFDGDHDGTVQSPDKNSKKYINRSYYLDDAVTEMMYMKMKRNDADGKELCSTSTSVVSNDFHNNLNLLSQLIGPSESEINIADDELTGDDNTQVLGETARADESIDSNPVKALLTTNTITHTIPSNSPKAEQDKPDPKKPTSSVECRKSIDKIYTLMKKFGRSHDTESKSSKSKYYSSHTGDVNGGRESSTFQGSDSGTSLKHHLTSSNPSCFSFEKNNCEPLKCRNFNRKLGSPTAVIRKVIISSKMTSQTPKSDSERNKKDRRKSGINSPTIKVPDNPLRAISQLLHEFENVQKNRQKPTTEPRSTKKSVELGTSEGKSASRQNAIKRRSRLDQHNDAQTERCIRVTTPKDKKNKSFSNMELPKPPYQQSPVDEKHATSPKKKIADLLDEAKEARGEAVRGPSKLTSRLNSLAQPKRAYVQAHSEEYQNKYGKTLMADRLQRLAASQPPLAPDRNTGSANSRSKGKRSGTEAQSAVSVKLTPPSVPSLERPTRTRHSTHSSPEGKERQCQGVGSSYKQITVPETPELLKKKMVAVESYVKNHYGRATSTAVVNEPPSVQKSRVPLLPNDIELASTTSSPTAEESTELGSRLHSIINTMIKSTSQGLEVLTECQESSSDRSKEHLDDFSVVEKLSRSERVSAEDSDYAVLDNKNVLRTVEDYDKATKDEQEEISIVDESAFKYDVQPFKSATELEKLENALCRHISVGTFQKRLRIKNLTLTPKQSMKKVFVLQSGDPGSLFVNASIASNLNKNTPENLSDFQSLPMLSKSHLDWSFANFPVQIATVGYSFPEYKSIQCGSGSLVKLFDEVSKSSDEEIVYQITNNKSDKDSQCLKCRQCQPKIEQAAQVDVAISTHVLDPERDNGPAVTKCDETKVENNHPLKDSSDNNKTVEKLFDRNQSPSEVQDKKKENASLLGNPDNIEYTTSLDILVGLLNEIQKITTCQTEITNADRNNNANGESKLELETILNKAAQLENSIKSSELISFTSLDKLRQLESNPSVFSYYLSDYDGSNISNKVKASKFIFPPEIPLRPKAIYADKEVGMNLIEKELVHSFTDTPSQIFPISIDHSTNMTSSVVGVLSQPSTQSLFSFAEYHSAFSSLSSVEHSNVIEIPQVIITTESNHSVSICEVNRTIEKSNENNSYKKENETNRIQKCVKITKTRYRLKSELVPVMKVKRDVLVTVYSILVFTVFAALSFPERIFHVCESLMI